MPLTEGRYAPITHWQASSLSPDRGNDTKTLTMIIVENNALSASFNPYNQASSGCHLVQMRKCGHREGR